MFRRCSSFFSQSSSDFVRRPLFAPSASSSVLQKNKKCNHRPKFLQTLEQEKKQRHVCFKFPSVLSVDDFCDSVTKFCREAEEKKVLKMSPRDKERSKGLRERSSGGIIDAGSSRKGGSSSSSSEARLAGVDYLAAAKCLSASITPSTVKEYLRQQKVFDPSREREPLVPFESARQLVLNNLPPEDKTTRDYFDTHDLQYVELDKFAQMELFVPNSGSPYTDTSNAAVPRRIPIVTIMGHIDHGKTTLLDSLQSSNIVATEPGLITQTIRAFTIQVSDTVSTASAAGASHMMTFIDTPGHRIFAEIRLSGSKIADVVLLLISLDEGVRGQTEEIVQTAIQHEKPLVVVLSKVDLFSGDAKLMAKRIEQIQEDLASLGIKVHFVGGDSQQQQEDAIQKTINSLRERWYRFDKFQIPQSLVSSAASTTVDPEEEKTKDANNNNNNINKNNNIPGKILRCAIGLCVSAKFGYNINVLTQLLRTATNHATFPRASPAASPTQARVLESFRDYNSERTARRQHHRSKASSAAVSSVGSPAGSFRSAHRKEAPVNIVAVLRNGALRVGMPFVCDQGWGVVEQVQNTWGDVLLSAAHPTAEGLPPEKQQQLQPGAAVVILGSQDTTCPGVGRHFIEVKSAAEAELTSKFRNRLRFFLERHPELTALLRPRDHRASKFRHIGGCGQDDEKELEKLYEYRLLYKEAKMPEVRESPLELQWRANQLAMEDQPKTMEEYNAYVKRCRVVHVLIKVDNWNSARVAAREIPRLATKDVVLNIVGAGFGPVSSHDMKKFGSNLHMIISYRAPRLQDSQLDFYMRARGMLYGEFDVYTDMLEWVKANVLALQREESEKRSAEKRSAQRAQGHLLEAAGFDGEGQRQKQRTAQQLTPSKR